MVFASRRALLVVAIALALVVTGALAVLIATGAGGQSSSNARSRSPIRVTVNVAGRGRSVPYGFLGLSLEYPAVPAYAGFDPAALDPVFEQLIRNLTPGQAPVLRIGGDSTDRTWWPTATLERPPGVNFAITDRWLAVTRALAQALRARLILGLNLEADNPALSASEAAALLDRLGPRVVRALELGNEPDLYASFPWYQTPTGEHVRGRPPDYDMAAFIDDFTRIAGDLPPHLLAGPSLGAPVWMRDLSRFLAAEPRVGLVTLHRYPLQLCFTPRQSPRYPTIDHLLSSQASVGLADAFAPYATLAHARGLSLRIDELNSVSCGADPAISQTFASALWALNTLFAMVHVGVHGVNIHTFPGAGYELFKVRRVRRRWQASVAPEYYGLMMFVRAAPAGSRLLEVSNATAGPVQTWATRSPSGATRVAAINRGAAARSLSIGVDGARFGPGRLERLTAPGVRSRTGVTLAGQSFGARTFTGALGGSPQSSLVMAVNGRYLIRLPPASAALLVLTPRAPAAG